MVFNVGFGEFYNMVFGEQLFDVGLVVVLLCWGICYFYGVVDFVCYVSSVYEIYFY